MANTNVSTNVSEKGVVNKAVKFLKETHLELRKTAWPTQDELKKMTILVLAAVAIVTIWIGGLDYALGWFTRTTLGY